MATRENSIGRLLSIGANEERTEAAELPSKKRRLKKIRIYSFSLCIIWINRGRMAQSGVVMLGFYRQLNRGRARLTDPSNAVNGLRIDHCACAGETVLPLFAATIPFVNFWGYLHSFTVVILRNLKLNKNEKKSNYLADIQSKSKVFSAGAPSSFWRSVLVSSWFVNKIRVYRRSDVDKLFEEHYLRDWEECSKYESRHLQQNAWKEWSNFKKNLANVF